MTRFLTTEAITELATHELVMGAAVAAAQAETKGSSVAPPRLDVDLPRGFLRVMPGAVDEVMGLKVMTNVEGVGNRYLLLLYHQSDGELLALLDADEVTRLRTAATTVVAARILQPEPQIAIGLIGSGFEATGHVRALARIWPLERIAVHSPSPERRVAFAERMTAELEIDVRPVDTAAAACQAASTLVLATKSRSPVLDGADLPPGAVALSIGSTRPDLRELDRATLARTSVLLVDDARQVQLESGDVMDAIEHGALEQSQLVPIGAALAARSTPPLRDARDVLTFKSVGTAVQDLALASALYDAAVATGHGQELGELARLKPFAAVASGA